jgi:hypothetical protein
MGNNKSVTTKIAGKSLAILIAIRMMVQHGAHRPIEHVQGFIGSHWMPPSGECLHRIVPAATMVDKFVENTLNTNKTQLLPSNYSTFDCLLFVRISYPEMDPSPQLIDATSCVKM